MLAILKTPLVYKSGVFVLVTIVIIWISRSSLRDVRHHGFYRFFVWEAILVLFLMNVDHWFAAPFSLRQIVSWVLLIVSLVLIYAGVTTFRKQGRLDQSRDERGLVGIEKTTELVTSGIYRYIRHPFYSSLLFLGWGIVLKNITWIGILLAIFVTFLLVITARREENENIQYFGERYRAYMNHTKMFVPFII